MVEQKTTTCDNNVTPLKWESHMMRVRDKKENPGDSRRRQKISIKFGWLFKVVIWHKKKRPWNQCFSTNFPYFFTRAVAYLFEDLRKKLPVCVMYFTIYLHYKHSVVLPKSHNFIVAGQKTPTCGNNETPLKWESHMTRIHDKKENPGESRQRQKIGIEFGWLLGIKRIKLWNHVSQENFLTFSLGHMHICDPVWKNVGFFVFAFFVVVYYFLYRGHHLIWDSQIFFEVPTAWGCHH